MCIRDSRNPKGQMRKKQSEYALQLTEKQKVKFVYGVMEKQFRKMCIRDRWRVVEIIEKAK